MLKRNLLVIALLVSCFVIPFASFAEEKAPEAKKEKCCDDKDATCCDKTDAKHHKCKKEGKCGSTKEGVTCCEDAHAKKDDKKEDKEEEEETK